MSKRHTANRRPIRTAAAVAGAMVWGGLVTGGFALLARHDYAVNPEEARAERAAHWPTESKLTPAGAGEATLLVFAHPYCPCTRATMAELGRLAAAAPGRFAARLVLVGLPGDAGLGSAHGAAAREIPGVQVFSDPAGAEAVRFGARTSGQVMLYDPAGRLRYAGGITPSRGHEGDSPGRAAVLAALGSPTGTDVVTLPAFGCALASDRRK